MLQIWVDADACPKAIKEILFRAAQRGRIRVVLVANRALYHPRSAFIKSMQVPDGFDVADKHIVEQITRGDLVVTADIPLAAEVIERGGHVLTPRGERYTRDNIRQRLGMRDFMDQLRGSGVATGGPAPLNLRDRQKFANQLDSFLAKSV